MLVQVVLTFGLAKDWRCGGIRLIIAGALGAT